MENEQESKTNEGTWEQACADFQSRLDQLKALSFGLRDISIVGGELDQLPSGYAASLLYEIGGSVGCFTAHSLTHEKAQFLVYQEAANWFRFIRNETE